MKAEILIQTMLAQGVIQALYAQSQTHSKILDDISRHFYSLPYNRRYGHTAAYIWFIYLINIMSNMYGLYLDKCIKRVLPSIDYLPACKREEIISIAAFDWSYDYFYGNPWKVRIPHSLIPSPWFYRVCTI